MINGTCFCGQITISSSQEPIRVSNCHCTDCQKWTGCAYETAVVFNKNDLNINGKIKFYNSNSYSGNIVSRGFCPNCGGSVLNKSTGFMDKIVVYAGILDNAKNYIPTDEIYTIHRLHSEDKLATAKKHSKYFS